MDSWMPGYVSERTCRRRHVPTKRLCLASFDQHIGISGINMAAAPV